MQQPIMQHQFKFKHGKVSKKQTCGINENVTQNLTNVNK